MKKLNIAQAVGQNVPRLLLTSFCLLLIFNTVGTSQAVVKYLSGHEPIKAVSFNIGDKTYEFDKEFKADDWLRQFSVNIQNTFSKDVTYVELGVIPVRPAEQKDEPVCKYEISKGSKSAALRGKDSGLLLKAKETTASLLNMRRSDAEYIQDRDFLDRHGYPVAIHELLVQIQEVVFSDGTMWSIGSWYKADPDDMSKLVRIDKDGKVIPLTVTVPIQEGFPVRINITRVDSSAGLYHLIDYSLRNVSEKKVAAYVVREGDGLSVTSYGPIEAGQIMATSTRIEDMNLKAKRIIAFDIDFVLFEDSTSWGADATKGSARVYGFFEGRNEAISRARRLLKNSEVGTLLEALTLESAKTNADLGNEKEPLGFGVGYRKTFSSLIRALEGSGTLGFEKQLAKLEASRIDIKGNQK